MAANFTADQVNIIKEKGNAAFKRQSYDEAVKYYTQALEVDPKNVTCLNNRAAAFYSMGQFEKSLDDAQKSTGIESQSKGYSRVGAAYWKLGKLDSALLAYETAYEIATKNSEAANLVGMISDNIKSLKKEINEVEARGGSSASDASTSSGTPPSSGPQVSPIMCLYVDLAVIVLAVLHVVSLLLMRGYSQMLWQFCLMAFQVRQMIILQETHGGIVSIVKGGFGNIKNLLYKNFSFQYLVLCLVMYFTATPPQLLLLAAMAIYAAIDLHRLRNILPRASVPAILYNSMIDTQLNKIATGQARDALLVNAAMSELASGVMIPLSGASWFTMLLFWQFLRFRYRSGDHYVRIVFRSVSDMLGKIFYHRLCPAMVGSLWTKFLYLLHQFAEA